MTPVMLMLMLMLPFTPLQSREAEVRSRQGEADIETFPLSGLILMASGLEAPKIRTFVLVGT